MEFTSIRQIRLFHELTQKQMAEILGIATVTYQKKEQGVVRWTLRDIARIKNKFNLDINLLKELNQDK